MNKFLIFIVVVLIIIVGFIYYNLKENDELVQPYIIGQIHAISDNSLLIAEKSQAKNYTGNIEELEGNAVWLKIEKETKILENKNELDFQDLKIGFTVKAWVTGPILESYPARAVASQIIILETNYEKITQCFIGGCSGELCTNDPEAISTCELLPGMECLSKNMTCELVKNECTWILSQEAADCFISIKKEQGNQVIKTRIGYLFEKAEGVK